MAEKEHHKYRDHLVDAKSTVTNAIDTWSEDGNPAQSLVNHVRSGWQCDAADEWMDDASAKGQSIVSFFQTAESHLADLIGVGQVDDESQLLVERTLEATPRSTLGPWTTACMTAALATPRRTRRHASGCGSC